MSRAFLVIVFISFCFLAKGQYTVTPSVFVSIGAGRGNHTSQEVSLNLIFDNDIIINGFWKKFKKRKSWEVNSNWIGRLFSNVPNEELEIFGIGIGKAFYLNEIETVRFNLTGGIGYSIFLNPQYDEFMNSGEVIYDKFESFALKLTPRIDFPFSRYYGLYFDGSVTVTQKRTFLGFSVGHIIGALRIKKSKRRL